MDDSRPIEQATTSWSRFWRHAALLVLLGLLVGLLLGQQSPAAHAALQVGGGNADVLFGRDNDNAANTFIQPPNVTAKQHLDNTDILLGGRSGDLLIGLLGDDVLHGESEDDILIGGTENFQAPNSDVIFGDSGNDINIWAPGDGSDAFLGGQGTDTHIFAPIVVENNRPRLFTYNGRQIPRVNIANQPNFRCTIERVPANQALGFPFITRFFVGENLAVTVRLSQGVEQVFCTSPRPNRVLYADLRSANPTVFVERRLSDFSGSLLGAIMQAP